MVADCRTTDKTELGLFSMLASVAHDIRTPLCSILGFLELLKEERDETVRRQYLANMEVCGHTLRELVDDLLDFSKLDAGKMVFRPELCDVREIVRSVVRTFSPAASEKGIRLSCVCRNVPFLRLDERRVSQVLFNLIGNAVKFTDRGHVTVRLSFRVGNGLTGMLRLSVSDTGVGITRRDMRRIATPYVRSIADERGGTGLGLSICKRIVDSAGGRLEISSVRGKGSTFTVVLPEVGYGRRDAAPAVRREAKRQDFSALRVLVADDFEMNRIVIVATCKQLGVGKVVAVSSGQQALCRLANSGRFDLLLTDVKMRGIDGGKLTELVRANPATAQLPVYLVTADAEAVGYAESVGANGCLVKPVKRERLLQVLSSVKKEQICEKRKRRC